MEFIAYGHAGIEGTHKRILEFTQKTAVIPKGQSVIGTRANFDPEAISALTQISKKLKLTIKVRNYAEEIIGDANQGFIPGSDIIVRKGPQRSPSTLLINANKAAGDLNKKLIELLKNPEEKIIVTLERLD
ncbi:MAG: DUF371 domain-containing protein [Candidatus Woesearchaeota archaeon]